jgi:putative transposase
MQLVSYSYSFGQLTYHVVLVTKYRTGVFITDRRKYVCENVLKWTCRRHEIEIIKIKVMEEHVHLFVRVRPMMSISDFFNLIKGCSSRKILTIYPEMRKELRGNHL